MRFFLRVDQLAQATLGSYPYLCRIDLNIMPLLQRLHFSHGEYGGMT